jgi:hypothetical protein
MVSKEKLKPSSWHIQDTKNNEKQIEIILLFNCEKPPLKLTIFTFTRIVFMRTGWIYMLKKTETLSSSLKIIIIIIIQKNWVIS